MNKKKLSIVIIIAIIIIVVAFSFLIKKSDKNNFVTAEIIEKTIIQTVEATGTINPVQTVCIGSQTSGMIKEIYVDFNSHVKKGQLLALIDPALIQAQVNQSKAILTSKKAAYQKAKSVLDYNLATYNRSQKLYAKNYISKNELDLSRSNYLSQKATLESAAAEISQAKATLENNLTSLRYTKIVSPVDGVVISREVEIGQTVAASFQTPTLFTVAQDLSDMQIETSVSEADIGKVKVGQTVKYTLDGYPEKTFNGKVSQIRLASTTTNNVVTYTVVIDVENSDNVLLPGMTANVEIITSKRDNVMVVPNLALKFTPETNKKTYEEQGVWILSKGKLRRIDVVTGLSDDAHTEISSGVIPDDAIIIIGSKNKKNKKAMQPPM